MKRILTIVFVSILSFLTIINGTAEISAEEINYYSYNNGGYYLDEATVPQGIAITGQSGQIRPRQDSVIKDCQYAFMYEISDPSVLSIDERGNWQALRAGTTTITIRVPGRDAVPNFEAELNAFGIQRVAEEPAIAYSPKVFTVEVSDDTLIPVHRLYHPGLRVHLYTTDEHESQELMLRGWRLEKVAWQTRRVTGQEVYRLYHSGLKVHLYTMDANEYKVLANRGWRQEGIAYRSTGETPVYRLYHRGIKKHLYTTDENEKNVLSTRGWKYEGIAWNVE